MRQVQRRTLGALVTLALTLGGMAVGTALAAPASAATPFCNDHYLPAGNLGVPGFVSGGTTTYKCTLSQGRTGYPVTLLQRSLKDCYGQNIAVDGSFGPATRSALIAAQRTAGVAADGLYGPVTAKAIYHSGYANGSGRQFCGKF
ncbi:peptidoglycan-binding protein [Cellulosimicrobium cellulans]|uniref:peptidoglycan-binding domain-containing protein n=1 Tax=Cellulosimicrobium cellulans TaxID=1710 RepID=UPI00196275EF|nr:peptidoglycan-binding domain-containing protein [Cellulosimicrobium cellulans]MBN0039948.1 peptidoglycan-binding protein [Cellulosimicrobium cellulans]